MSPDRDAAGRNEADREGARVWFEALRDRLCAVFEAIEAEAGNVQARFLRQDWTRDGGGGGAMAIMRGRVLEKVGVNVSTVWGEFPPAFAATIPGAADDPRFWATGISLVAHPLNPMVPATHLNTRLIQTTRSWFGGGADLTPSVVFADDAADFHAALAAPCEAWRPGAYAEFKAECDRYFFLPHRGEARGIGGIFFDNLASDQPERDFALVRAVGEAFLDVYPRLVRRRRAAVWSDADKAVQRAKRARYVEFNLLYDRGTRFGLATGGNPEAVLMSLPPDAAW